MSNNNIQIDAIKLYIYICICIPGSRAGRQAGKNCSVMSCVCIGKCVNKNREPVQ